MKKTLLILTLTLILTGCGNTTKDIDNNNLSELSNIINLDETGAKLVCTSDIKNDEENYSVGSKYVIYANDKNYVTKINSVEVVESNNQETLNYFENYLNNNYEKISVYGGFDKEIKLENNKVIANASINYEQFNLESYATDYPEIQEFLNDEYKLTTDSLADYYKLININCTKK